MTACDLWPYIFSHCLSSRLFSVAASLAFLVLIDRFASCALSIPLSLGGLTWRLVIVRCSGACVARIRVIVSLAISRCCIAIRLCSKMRSRFRYSFGARRFACLDSFSWFFWNASIDFRGVISMLEEGIAVGGGDGACSLVIRA